MSRYKGHSLPRFFRKYSCFSGVNSITECSMNTLSSGKKKRIPPYFFFIFLMVLGIASFVAGQNLYKYYHSQEQHYVVRNCVFQWPEDSEYAELIDEEGNVWEISDPPEYEEGTEIRVLFNSKGTKIIEDDVIVDLTER